MAGTSKDLESFDRIQNVLENEEVRKIVKDFLKRDHSHLCDVIQLWELARDLDKSEAEPSISDLHNVLEKANDTDGICIIGLETSSSSFLKEVQNLCYNQTTLWTEPILKCIKDKLTRHKKS